MPPTAVTLETLQQAFAAIPDPLDLPRNLSQRECDAYEVKRETLRNQISLVRRAQETLHEVEPKIAHLTKWRDDLLRWEKTLQDELDAKFPVEVIREGDAYHEEVRARVAPRNIAEIALKEKLDFSLKRIRVGLSFRFEDCECVYAVLPLDVLMREAGYRTRDQVGPDLHLEEWGGSLNVVLPRLRDLEARRDEAKFQIERALSEAQI